VATSPSANRFASEAFSLLLKSLDLNVCQRLGLSFRGGAVGCHNHTSFPPSPPPASTCRITRNMLLRFESKFGQFRLTVEPHDKFSSLSRKVWLSFQAVSVGEPLTES